MVHIFVDSSCFTLNLMNTARILWLLGSFWFRKASLLLEMVIACLNFLLGFIALVFKCSLPIGNLLDFHLLLLIFRNIEFPLQIVEL